MKKCPFCAEEIQEAAVKCKHCGSMLTEVLTAVPPSATDAAQPEPTNVLDEELRRLIVARRKIDAIKLLREKKPMGLAEAKAFVDALEKSVDPAQIVAAAPQKASVAGGFGCLLITLLVFGGGYFLFARAIWNYMIAPPGGSTSTSAVASPRDDLELFVQRFGRPDSDESSETEVPRPPL